MFKRSHSLWGEQWGWKLVCHGSYVVAMAAGMYACVLPGISTGPREVTAADSGSHTTFLLSKRAETCPSHTHTHIRYTHTHTNQDTPISIIHQLDTLITVNYEALLRQMKAERLKFAFKLVV